MRTIIALFALAVCALALPVSNNQGTDYVLAQLASTTNNGQTTVAIDVSNDFVDSLGDDHKMEVLLDVTVTSGVVSINNKPTVVNQGLTLQVTAIVSETIRSTGVVVRQLPKMVTVLVAVQATQQVSQGVVANALNVQELIQEVDGTRLTQVDVQQTVITLDENGNEATRVTGAIAVSQSVFPDPQAAPIDLSDPVPNASSDVASTAAADTTTTDPITTDPIGKSKSKSDSDSDSTDSSDSSSSSDSSDGDGEDRTDEKTRARRIGVWIGKVLLVAGVTFVSVMTVIVLLRCLRNICCGAPTTRVVSTNGNKLHYVPLAVDDVLDFKNTKETSVTF